MKQPLSVIEHSGFPQIDGIEYVGVADASLPPEPPAVGMMETVKMNTPEGETWGFAPLQQPVAMEEEGENRFWEWTTLFLTGSVATIVVMAALGVKITKD